MCGIFGVIGDNRSNKTKVHELVRQLFLLSESRGKEASGFAYTRNKNIFIHRTHEVAHTLIQQKEFSDAMKSLLCNHHGFGIIGHSRLATNGSPYSDMNNQPVIGRNNVVVHNGIIVNASSLWKTYYPKQKQPDLDTAVMVKILERFAKNNSMSKALRRLYAEIVGEASIALLNQQTASMYLATNTGSIYYAYSDTGLFLFSSERYITKTALRQIGDKGQIIQLPAGQIRKIPFGVHNVRIKRLPKLPIFTISQNLYRNSLHDLKNHEPNHEAINKIPRCTKCILPITMPLIQFDRHGVCNFCRTYKKASPLGQNALENYLTPFRSKNGSPDCIVALSGGRDSSYGLHYAKNILKLNPIAYTYDWGMVTDIARRNQSRLVSALGVEHIWVSANIDAKRKNIKKNVEAWLAKPDIAMVPLFMAGDKQAEYYIEELKRKTNIKLAIYCRGNQLEDERFKFGYFGIFDGTPKGVIHNLSMAGKLAMATYFAKACVSNPRYVNSSLIDTAFAFASSYLMPHKDFLFLWHFVPWKEKIILSTLTKTYGWETPMDTIATWRIDDGTPPFYNYIYYHVQGFTEHDGLRSNQIREGHITRKEALALVQKENRPRHESLKWYFDVIGMNGDKALSIIDNMPTRY